METETVKPTGIPDQLKAMWGKLTPRRKLVLVGAIVATLAAVGIARLVDTGPAYGVLFSGMSAEEAGEVTAELTAQKIPFRIGTGGTTIEVPQDRIPEVRIALASAGLPRGGGVGFEIFDDQTFGTTSFVEQVNYRRALQGELSRSISSLDSVEAARVHIAMGKRSIFREADEPPSASVALKLRRGRELSAPQVRGIVHLVASSVDGLPADRVVVIDDRGNVLSSGDQPALGAESQRDFERDLAGRVRSMLEKVVGAGHVAVVVTAEMDYRRVNTTEEMYDKDNTAIRSEVKLVEGAAGAGPDIGGIAGARGNLPGAPAPTETGGGTAGASRLSQTTNYEVPRVVKQTVGPAVQLRRLYVAILVDHKRVAAGKGDEPGQTLVEPRTGEELAHIAAIAREAAGVDPERGDRIEVRNVPFEDMTELDLEAEPVEGPTWLPLPPTILVPAAAAAGLLLIGIALFVLLRRRDKPRRGLRPHVLPLPAAIHEVEKALEMEAAGELSGLGGRQLGSHSGDVHQRVLLAVRGDTMRAARVLTALLAEPKGDGP